MKNIFVVILLWLGIVFCASSQNPSYYLKDGVISKEVLNNYLSRSITQAEFLNHNYYIDGAYPSEEDDERMLLNIGAKFIGRAVYRWGRESAFNTEWLDNAKKRIEKMHSQDPDMVFQACIFEIATAEVEQIAIPEWVFTAFGKEPEKRNFIWDNIKYLNGLHVNERGNRKSCVPDVSREETQLLFYYMAVRYMETGAEAIHFGQAYLMGMEDEKQHYAGWRKVVSLVKEEIGRAHV